MPRNGSGTYSTPNSFTSGTTIESAAMNANFSDVGTEITNSVAKDGQTAMTGPFKAANGTAAAPGYTFGADTDTGFFRKDGNTIGVACGGTEVASFSTSGVSFLPTGTVMLFAQTTAPTGWTKLTTHNNAAPRIVSGTASSGGSLDFTSAFAARTIEQANLPNVNLSVSGVSASSSTSVTINNGTNVLRSGVTGAPSGTGSTTWGTSTVTASATTTTTLSGNVPLGGSGTALSFAVKYVDVILAQKA